MFYTYIHRKKDCNDIFYVGKGKHRRGGARKDAKENRSIYWSRTAEKHGFVSEIVANWANEEDAFEHEKFLIVVLREMGCNLVNLTDGGDGLRGFSHSDEFRMWQSQRMRDQYLDPAARKAQSEAQSRRFATSESRLEHATKVRSGWSEEKRLRAAERMNERVAEHGGLRTRINDEMLVEMVSLRLRGVFRRDVANKFGLSQSRVNALVNSYIRKKTGMNLLEFRLEHPDVVTL